MIIRSPYVNTTYNFVFRILRCTFATTDKSQPKWQYFLHSLISDNQNDNNGWRRIMYAVVGDGWRPSNRDWAVGWFSIVDAQMCFVFNVLHFLCTHCIRRLLKLIQRHYLYFGSDCVGKCQWRPNHFYVCCLICKLFNIIWKYTWQLRTSLKIYVATSNRHRIFENPQ